MSRRRQPMDLHTIAFLIAAGTVLAGSLLVVVVVVVLALGRQQ